MLTSCIDGIGTLTAFRGPSGFSLEKYGTYALVADSSNHNIRKIILTTSVVSTFVGRLVPTSGFANDIGTNALFSNPTAVVISQDNSYALVADTNNHNIRKIEISTLAVTTFVGGSTSGSTNGIGTNSFLNSPSDIVFSFDGSYALVADTGNHQIRKIEISSRLVSAFIGSSLGSANGIGTSATLRNPSTLTLSVNNSYALVADTGNHRIRRVQISTLAVTTLVGGSTSGSTNGIGTNSLLSSSFGVTLSPDESYALVADTGNNRIRKIVMSTLLLRPLIGSSSGLTNGIGTVAFLDSPRTITISPDDSAAYIMDFANNRIASFPLSSLLVSTVFGGLSPRGSLSFGTLSNFASSPSTNFVLVVDSSRHLLIKIELSTYVVTILSGGGMSGSSFGATDGVGTNILYNTPSGVFLSNDGTYALIADTNNHRIRQVVLSSMIATRFIGNSAGDIDGIGTNGLLRSPSSVVISPTNDYALVADTGNNKIRKIILSTLLVNTLVGGHLGTRVGDVNGIGTNALLSSPSMVKLSPSGSFALLVDTNNHRIRKIEISTLSISAFVGRWASYSDGAGEGNFSVSSCLKLFA